MKINRHHFGPLFLLGTYSFWGAHAVVVALSGMGAIGTMWLSIFSVFGFVILGIFAKQKFSFKESTKLIPASAIRVIELIFTYGALKVMDAGIVTTFLAAGSLVMICVLAPRRDEVVKIEIALLSLAGVIGIFFVSRTDLNDNLFTFDLKLLLPIAAMICLAWSMVIWRDSTVDVHPTMNLAYLHFWTAIISFPVALAISVIFNQRFAPTTNPIYLLFFIALAGIGDLFYVSGQKHTTVTLNGVLSPLVAVFAAITGLIFAEQILEWWQWAGLLVVVVSTSLATIVNSVATDKERQAAVITDE